MVVVSISETYDLHTKVNKMTLIGVHTPKKELIQKTYPGLCMNFKYFRIVKQDVVLSTAQQLPLGVDQIGLDTGQIRPQDMMNPILYKAVSNDSWSTLEARLNGLADATFQGSRTNTSGDMAFADNDGVTGLADEHGVYYSLLSNRDGFRAAHPQQGVEMRGLVPLVFEKLYTFGENYRDTTGSDPGAPAIGDAIAPATGLVNRVIYPRMMRGNAKPMPRLNTTYLTWGREDPYGYDDPGRQNGMGDGNPYNQQVEMPSILPVMLGCIILPPVTAQTGILYYRMVTRCWIEFTDPRPMAEITSFSGMNLYSGSVYHSDYEEQSKSMDSTTDMVDIKNGEIEKIMEGR